jgi:hypothetical protein
LDPLLRADGKRRLGRVPRLISWLVVVLLLGEVAVAQPRRTPGDPLTGPSSSDFGGIGLLQTRTARFADDGQFELGYYDIDPYRRYLFNFQLLPWLEGTFRYTDVKNRGFFSGLDINRNRERVSFKDRGADLKIRLLQESEWLPAVAVGFQDGLGTGIFSGEYVVASKRYYDFDLSLGLGWGYNGARGGLRNPATFFSEGFRSRSADVGVGGRLGLGAWFGGAEVSPFGGIEYYTPIRGLSVKLEYDGNDYLNEPLANRFEIISPVNYGVVYRPFAWIEVALGRERGTETMLRATLRSNFHDPGLPKLDETPPVLKPRPAATGGAQLTSTVGQSATLRGVVRNPAAANTLLADLDMQLARLGSTRSSVTIDSSAVVLAVSGSLSRGAADALAAYIFENGPAENPQVAILDDFGYAIYDRQEASAQAALQTAATLRSPATASEAVGRGFSPDQAKALLQDLEGAGFFPEAVDLRGDEVVVYVTPQRFRQTARSIGWAARVAANHAPADVERITVVLVSGGMQTGRATIYRRDLEAAAANIGSAEEIFVRGTIQSSPSIGIPATAYAADRYPDFTWFVTPATRQHVGGGDVFFAYQIYVAVTGQLEITRGLYLTSTVGFDLYNNFDELTVESNSRIPKVRSDIKEYLQQGNDSLIRLQTNYLRQLSPDLYTRLSAGIFEEMYGGVGAEILYRPYGSRLAVGLDVNRVRQREFDQRLRFRDYVIDTGHLNLYYELPFYNLLAQTSVGQYLAGDRGATFQLSRLFDSGIRAGAFFTLTDIPFDLFGEGSFDKGVFLAIPLDLFQVGSTRSTGVFGFRPLTKDGGQRLSIGPRLYDLTVEGNLDSVLKDWNMIAK